MKMLKGLLVASSVCGYFGADVFGVAQSAEEPVERGFADNEEMDAQGAGVRARAVTFENKVNQYRAYLTDDPTPDLDEAQGAIGKWDLDPMAVAVAALFCRPAFFSPLFSSIPPDRRNEAFVLNNEPTTLWELAMIQCICKGDADSVEAVLAFRDAEYVPSKEEEEKVCREAKKIGARAKNVCAALMGSRFAAPETTPAKKATAGRNTRPSELGAKREGGCLKATPGGLRVRTSRPKQRQSALTGRRQGGEAIRTSVFGAKRTRGKETPDVMEKKFRRPSRGAPSERTPRESSPSTQPSGNGIWGVSRD
jgi:hypothetical protein